MGPGPLCLRLIHPPSDEATAAEAVRSNGNLRKQALANNPGRGVSLAHRSLKSRVSLVRGRGCGTVCVSHCRCGVSHKRAPCRQARATMGATWYCYQTRPTDCRRSFLWRRGWSGSKGRPARGTRDGRFRPLHVDWSRYGGCSTLHRWHLGRQARLQGSPQGIQPHRPAKRGTQMSASPEGFRFGRWVARDDRRQFHVTSRGAGMACAIAASRAFKIAPHTLWEIPEMMWQGVGRLPGVITC